MEGCLECVKVLATMNRAAVNIWVNVAICFFMYLFPSWVHWVFIAVCRLSLFAVREGYSSYGVWLLTVATSLLASHRLQGAPASVVVVHGLSCMWNHPGDWTCAPCIGRWILNHWTTRGAQSFVFYWSWIQDYSSSAFLWVSTVWGKYPRVQLLNHAFNFVRNHQTTSPKWLYYFAFPPAMNESSCCSASSLPFGGVGVFDGFFCCFFNSNRCEWYLIMVLICNSLMILSIFSYVYLPHGYLFLLNCLFRSLPIFKSFLTF